MALSYVSYTGNGSTTDFNVTFDYISKSHVKVLLDGVESTAFTWLSATQIRMTTAPANGVTVKVKRSTPNTARVVNFTNGSTLNADTDLDTDSNQLFFISQEAYDNTVDVVAPDGSITTEKIASGSVTEVKLSFTPTKVVTTIAALKALTGALLTGYVEVSGYLTTGDGGGGLFRWVASDATADDSGTIIAPTAGGGRFRRVYQGGVSVHWFGAVGDGVANDTVAIQAALNSGATIVRGWAGKTYLVNQVSTRTVNGVAQRYCLLLPTGVEFDLNGGTLKLGAAQNAALVMNAAAASDFAIRNGAIDGNKANQTAPGAGDMPCVFLYGATRARVEGLRAINVRQYAGRFLDVTGGTFRDLHCTDSDGDGWSFGIDGGYTAQVRRAQIDNISADSCTGSYGGGLQGNPVLFTVEYCTVGTIRGRSSAGGIKIQDSSVSSTFDELVCTGSTSANSGVKVQGNSGAGLFPRQIAIGRIVSEACHSEGLYIFDAYDVTIGEYIGNGNAVTSAVRDVVVQADRISIGTAHSRACGGIGIVLQGTGSYKVGQIHVHNPNGRAVQIAGACFLIVDAIEATDDRGGSALLTRALSVTSAATGRVGVVRTNLAHSTADARLSIPSADYAFEVGAFYQGTDAPEGIISPAAAATSTVVNNSNVFRNYVGGASDYAHPIIQIIPLNSAARALGATSVTVTDSGTAARFTLGHGAAGGTEKFFWKVLGWRVLATPSS